ncbi:MAG: hypothetical protein KKE61_05765, partial [Proteobacteria bacterium]|nr:hypothetical protein [Pseudomonadota bacterium]
MQSVKIFIFFTMLSLLMGCSSLSLNYVKNAEIVDISQADEFVITSKRSESTKLLLNGHYVKSGESLVFLIRRFEKGNLFVFDDESFEKLTIEIKNYKIGKPIKFGSTVVKFYYSRGNSPFIYKGHGLYSSHGTGYLIIKKQNKNS